MEERCDFCLLRFDAMRTFHPVNGCLIRAHDHCLKYSSNFCQRSDKNLDPEMVQKEVNRVKKLNCSAVNCKISVFCSSKERGGCSCANVKCRRNFHFPCAPITAKASNADSKLTRLVFCSEKCKQVFESRNPTVKVILAIKYARSSEPKTRKTQSSLNFDGDGECPDGKNSEHESTDESTHIFVDSEQPGEPEKALFEPSGGVNCRSPICYQRPSSPELVPESPDREDIVDILGLSECPSLTNTCSSDLSSSVNSQTTVEVIRCEDLKRLVSVGLLIPLEAMNSPSSVSFIPPVVEAQRVNEIIRKYFKSGIRVKEFLRPLIGVKSGNAALEHLVELLRSDGGPSSNSVFVVHPTTKPDFFRLYLAEMFTKLCAFLRRSFDGTSTVDFGVATDPLWDFGVGSEDGAVDGAVLVLPLIGFGKFLEQPLHNQIFIPTAFSYDLDLEISTARMNVDHDVDIESSDSSTRLSFQNSLHAPNININNNNNSRWEHNRNVETPSIAVLHFSKTNRV